MTVTQTADYLKTLDHVLLLTHVRPDGDTLGCAVALCCALRALGKEAFLLKNEEITSTYEPYASAYWAGEDFIPQSVVAVDVATQGLLPENAQKYADCVDLCIDHHPSNSHYARELCLDISAAAACEIIYEIVTLLTPLTKEIALPLYIGLSTDCGCFQYGNTTPRTHRIAAALMDLMDVSQINRELFQKKSRVRMQMEAEMTSQMQLFHNGRTVVMQIPLALREKYQATNADIEELSSLAAQVQGTDCGITLRELKPGVIKISMRTGPAVDACAACTKVGGGGHRAASGATVEGTMSEVQNRILAAVTEVMEG